MWGCVVGADAPVAVVEEASLAGGEVDTVPGGGRAGGGGGGGRAGERLHTASREVDGSVSLGQCPHWHTLALLPPPGAQATAGIEANLFLHPLTAFPQLQSQHV